jgi:rubrerythrin
MQGSTGNMNGFSATKLNYYWVCEVCGQYNHKDFDECIACGKIREDPDVD